MIKWGLLCIAIGIWMLWAASGWFSGIKILIGIAFVVGGVGILVKVSKMFGEEWKRTAPKDDDNGIEEGEKETK